MDNLTIELEKEKDTPGTRKYKEVLGEGRQRGIIGSVYVLKDDLKAIGDPDRILVTITPIK